MNTSGLTYRSSNRTILRETEQGLLKNMRFAEHHLFERMGKTILFNVETMYFYEVSPLIKQIVLMQDHLLESDKLEQLHSNFTEDEIQDAAKYLVREKFLIEDSGKKNLPVLKRRSGIRHLELMITHDCNMRCRYCYGSHGDGFKNSQYLYGASCDRMSLDTARQGIEYLIEESGSIQHVSVTFFGGEPLLEPDLIQQVGEYVRQREIETGKEIGLSLSTNAVLLDRKAIDLLQRLRIGCQISIDGAKEHHDRNRCLAQGIGSYDLMIGNVRELLKIRRGRVPARATVSCDHVHILEIIEHLCNLGFGSVHVEPSISLLPGIGITKSDVNLMKEQNEEAARFLVRRVRKNQYFNYTNLVRFIRHTRVIHERAAYYCGAGRTYFALAQDGSFYPCHRFAGMTAYRMGDLSTGMDLTLQTRILELTVDHRPVCSKCWARYICGGGCWKHAVDINGSLETPDANFSCEITRHLIECAMAVNTELKVSDQDILSGLYETNAEPYLVDSN